MPYDEKLARRMQDIIGDLKNYGQKKMFGGICYLINGNMFCGVYKQLLILRLGEENAEKALRMPFVKPFDITGKPMKGWVMVEQNGLPTENDLRTWLFKAKEFVDSLPPK
jgi:TfoX/Sxy family transcriptional regulator of competence genes